MNAAEVITRLKPRGVTFEADGTGGLRVVGVDKLTAREKAVLKANKGAILRALSQPTDAPSRKAVALSCTVTAPLPAHTEAPEPKERRCSQCAHFDRSPYGYPLGLCQQHGNRLQHSTSQPVRSGCCHFVIRPPADDTRTCLQCRNYSQLTTLCSVVNTGCPYPAIPPCRGESFELKEMQS